MVTLIFLGKLADLAGEDTREVAAPLDWDGLLALCDTPLADEISGERVKIALDGDVLADKTTLAALAGSEVALLPPVSGG